MANNFFDSNFFYTSPVRKFKANDPYYWEVDNIPLTQLEENCNWLKDQVDGLIRGGDVGGDDLAFTANGGGGGTGNGPQGTGASRSSAGNIGRGGFKDLRPSVFGSTVSVEPGRFTARVNDAKTLATALSEPDLNEPENYLGGGTNWFTKDPAAVRTAVAKIYSSTAADSLKLNGLFERFSHYPVYGVGLGGTTTLKGTMTSDWLSDNLGYTGFPVKTYEKVYDILENVFNQTRGNIAYTQSISKEFVKRWRGVARTAVVDVTGTLETYIPQFTSQDYFYYDSNGTKNVLSNVNQRIDLVFIYTKPVDQGSAKVIDRGGISTISEPKLGVLLGAGLGLNYHNNESGVLATIAKNPDGTSESDADGFMLGSKADKLSEEGGFVLADGTKVYGSFPAPDDLMNLAPLLANDLATTDMRTVGQSILPVAYVVVTSDQGGTIPANNLIDIRPFFRTAELTYDERAGVAGATPSLSLANPAVGRRELEEHIQTAVTNAFGSDTPVAPAQRGPIAPRVIGGGYVWGGKQYGPEGAITAAMGDGGNWIGTGINGLSYNSIPDKPDWDWATWSQYLDGGEDGAGIHKNDWINFKYAMNRISFQGTNSQNTVDFEEVGSSNDVFPYSFGTGIGKGIAGSTGDPAPIMMYWVRKRFWVTLPSGFSNYCVKASLLNCVSLTQGGFGRNTNREFESGGTNGIWVTKGPGWFEINVGWVGPDPYQEAAQLWPDWSTDTAKAATFPSSDRDSDKFRAWAVLYPELEVKDIATGIASTAGTGNADNGFVPNVGTNATVKVDSVGVCTYPTVEFEVVGIPNGWQNNGFLLYHPAMPHNGTTQLNLR